MSSNILGDEARPDKSWSLKQLESYSLDRMAEVHGYGRATITQIWRLGSSLSLIRELKRESRNWMEWVKSQPFSLTTATNAINLFERKRSIIHRLDASLRSGSGMTVGCRQEQRSAWD